jgi:hypothetical protein
MDDEALIATYEAFNTPVDQFIGNPGLAEAFASMLRNRAGTPGLDSQKIMQRLVYLRKRGRLPRLRRNYYGRNASNN